MPKSVTKPAPVDAVTAAGIAQPVKLNVSSGWFI
jgi:hypothetical protein